jgi:hypothetical protein
LLAVDGVRVVGDHFRPQRTPTVVRVARRAWTLTLVFASLVSVAATTFRPFLYFRF